MVEEREYFELDKCEVVKQEGDSVMLKCKKKNPRKFHKEDGVWVSRGEIQNG